MKENTEFNIALNRVGGDRYNQGFYRFGPLEQSSSGSLVKYEDAANAYEWHLAVNKSTINAFCARIETLNLENKLERESVEMWKQSYATLIATTTRTIQRRSWTAFALSFYVFADAAIHLFVGG